MTTEKSVQNAQVAYEYYRSTRELVDIQPLGEWIN